MKRIDSRASSTELVALGRESSQPKKAPQIQPRAAQQPQMPQNPPVSPVTPPRRHRQISNSMLFSGSFNRSAQSTPKNSAPNTPARVGGHQRIRTEELHTALNEVLQERGSVGDKGWPQTAALCEKYFQSGYENIWQRNEGGYVSVPSNFQEMHSDNLRLRDVHWTPENTENGNKRHAHFTAPVVLTFTDPTDNKQRQIEVEQDGKRYFIMARIHQDDRIASVQTLDRLFAVNSKGKSFNVSVKVSNPKKNDPDLKRKGKPLSMRELEAIVGRLKFTVDDVPMKNQPFFSPKTLSLDSSQLSTGTTKTIAKKLFEDHQPELQRLRDNQYTPELIGLLERGELKIDAVYRDDNTFPFASPATVQDEREQSIQKRDSILKAIFVAARKANNAEIVHLALNNFNEKINGKSTKYREILKAAFTSFKERVSQNLPFDGLTVHAPGSSSNVIKGEMPLHILFDNQLGRFRGMTYTKQHVNLDKPDVSQIEGQEKQSAPEIKNTAGLGLNEHGVNQLLESLPNPRANQGGGDCLFHALEGRNLVEDEVRKLRREVADVRLTMPENAGNNLAQAGQAYHDAEMTAELQALQGLDGLSNAQYADIQATLGIYAGDDEINQWIMHRNQSTGTATTVWLIDQNEGQVATYNGNARQVQNGSVNELSSQLRAALDSGAVVIRQDRRHFERILRN